MGRGGRGVVAASETSIEITFTFRGIRCRERLKLKPTPPNLKRAERHRAAIIDAIERGTFDYGTTFPDSPRRLQFVERQGEAMLAQDYLDAWLERAKKRLKSSTYDDYRKIVDNLLIPKFGKTVLADLSRPMIRDWLSTMTSSNKRLSNIQSVLRSALQDAVSDDLIETNPLYGWKFENKDVVKREDDVDPFSSIEQAAILEHLSDQVRNMIQFAFWTGLRTSELVALDWGDIDWRRGYVRISRALTQVATEFEDTKTKSGRRDVRLLAPALEALQAQKAFTFMKNAEVFQDPRWGERWAGDQPIRQVFWVKALQLAKVRYRRPYQTRHTYASMMLSAGESPMWVAQQMGHSDWTMIARVYGRWIPETAPEAGNKAVALFAAPGKAARMTN